jgi:cytidine deaminase
MPLQLNITVKFEIRFQNPLKYVCLNMEKVGIAISYEYYKNFNELEEADQALCSKAQEALQSSYSPYSGFKVGTAIRLKDGQIILGSNQENIAYPSGLCAERVALFSIGSSYPDTEIESMAITAFTDRFEITKPVTSCGACLQVMAQFELKQQKPISVLFYCLDGEIIKVPNVKSLLPFGFIEDRLSL